MKTKKRINGEFAQAIGDDAWFKVLMGWMTIGFIMFLATLGFGSVLLFFLTIIEAVGGFVAILYLNRYLPSDWFGDGDSFALSCGVKELGEKKREGRLNRDAESNVRVLWGRRRPCQWLRSHRPHPRMQGG